MLSKVKAPEGVLRTLFLLILSISFLISLEPLASAQVTGCPGNIVKNGNFTSGLAGGPLSGSGAVSSWTAAYGTPDVGTGMGAQDIGVVGMWGNMNPSIGEGLQQQLSSTNSLVAGKTYLVSFNGRVILGSGQTYAHFRVRASTAALTSWGTANTVGRTTTPVGTAWTPISFVWTAPAGGPYQFLTINVENDLSANDGAQTSYGQIDNVCIREVPPDFQATTVCQGQSTAFTANAPGATSWNWNFGDNTTSTQQNPLHLYANAGTYNVTLCVNGTTSCVTKPVIVKSGPPAPVITGPSDACGLQTATYSVPASGGVIYSWAVTGGTISGPTNGNSVNVTWGSTGGTISVTVTNKGGCSSSSKLAVSNCDLHLGDCCKEFQSKIGLKNFTHMGNGVYSFNSTVSVNHPNIIRVTAHIISASVSYAPAGCAKGGPINSYVVSASPAPPGFTSTLPVQNGDEVIWYNSTGGVSVNGLSFPFQIKFPPVASTKCREYVSFCIKYTFTDRNCRTCEVIKCFGPFLRNELEHPVDETR